MNASINDVIHGFHITDIQDVPELDGRAYLMRHKASGARMIYLENEDVEKAFSISFKTPPVDDTGVFHILEHSLLCGSKRYPVKEPFTRLLKTSMKTFLNAFTAPDYTTFPVATTNQRDLENLANVYLDAVLNPLAVEDELIFRQEGWHLEAPDGTKDTLGFSGVVYNEMKGALSGPIQKAVTEMQRMLFPGGTYGYVSGGDPVSIPNLSFEQFKDAYRRHYRLDNCYCVLYGKTDAEAMLKLIDEEHFTPWLAAHGSDAYAPNEFVAAYPGNSQNKTLVLDSPDHSPMILFGSLLPSNDPHAITRASIVGDALFGTAEAPVKSALLATGLVGDVAAICMGNGRQSHFTVLFLQAEEKDHDVLIDTMVEASRKAIESDEFHEQVQATVDALEFAWRAGSDRSTGIEFCTDCLPWWMDGHDDDPLRAVRYEKYLESHQEALESGVYEDTVRQLVLDCEHRACLALVLPEDGKVTTTEAKLPDLDDSELKAVVQLAEELSEKRLAPDSPEAVATLPLLKRSDVNTDFYEPPCTKTVENGTTFLRLDLPTHGIDHLSWHFDLSEFSEEDLLYLSLMCSLMGELPTLSKTAAQAQVAIKSLLGNMELEVNASDCWSSEEIVCALSISLSALETKLEQAVELAWEILLETDFSDLQRIKSCIERMVISFEHTLVNKAITIAAGRAKRSVSKSAAINDRFKGVESCLFLRELLEQEDGIAKTAERIEALRSSLFETAPVLVCCAGSERASELARESALADRKPREHEGFSPYANELPEPAKDLAIATGVAANVGVFSLGENHAHNGYCMVAEKLLQYEYLWQTVRVSGGAYVVAAAFDKQGNLTLASGRDPRIDDSYEAFKSAGQWLASLECSEEEVDGYVISTLAERSKPRKPDELLARAALRYIAKRSDEQRAQCRKEILETTLEHLRSLGASLAAGRLIATNTVANSSLLDASSRNDRYESLA